MKNQSKPGDIDLNLLRMFQRVAEMRNFSEAARALALPKSTVSRGIAKLESELGTRLFHRSTRDVALTQAGMVLHERNAQMLSQVISMVEDISDLSGNPRGLLKVTTGIGFGVRILSTLVPRFMALYPSVQVSVELTSRSADLIAEGIDIAVRLGPMKDSALVTTRLASVRRYMCASPRYLAARGAPATLEKLAEHDTVEMPSLNGKPRHWTAVALDGAVFKIPLEHRLCVNDPLTIYHMVVNGAGIGCLSGYLCIPDLKAGLLVQLFFDLTIPSVEINLVFPSSKALSPTVRAFVDFMKANTSSGLSGPANALA